jgi:protein-S-isoprenylcysteine O-methyltransferase Ste14
MTVGIKAAVVGLVGLVGFGACLFLPAGTFDYWQAWLFIALFAVTGAVPTIIWARTRPEVLQRRMTAGPTKETRPAQKLIVVGIQLWFFGTLVVSALDHRFGWSDVPIPVVLLGDALVVVGLGLSMLVVHQNSYAAATITVEAGQTVVSTGLYGLVRHPMYFGSLIMVMGMAPALGSYWALLLLIPGALVLGLRILDEEAALREELAGYADYTQKVRYRLVPGVW